MSAYDPHDTSTIAARWARMHPDRPPLSEDALNAIRAATKAAPTLTPEARARFVRLLKGARLARLAS